MKVTVIDYGLSNLLSVQHAFAHFGAEVQVTSSPADVLAADALVLPGVGAFQDGMQGLEQLGLIEPIKQKTAQGTLLLGICLGMQMMNTYFLVAEEAERRGWDGPLLALFEQMKKERYMFTEPVDGHWDGHITRDNVDRFKHPIHVTPGSRLERLTGKQTLLGASMHNYRITHQARSLTVAGRTDDGTIEALEYGEQMLGVQFHPEADDQNDELFRAIL